MVLPVPSVQPWGCLTCRVWLCWVALLSVLDAFVSQEPIHTAGTHTAACPLLSALS